MANNDSFKIDDTILKNRKLNTEKKNTPEDLRIRESYVPGEDTGLGDIPDMDDGETIHIEIGELDYDPGSGEWKQRRTAADTDEVEIRDADYRVLSTEESTSAGHALTDKNAKTGTGPEWKYAGEAGSTRSRKKRSQTRNNTGRNPGRESEEKKPLPMYLQIIYGLVVLLALGATFVCPYRYLNRHIALISDAAEAGEGKTGKVQPGTYCTLKSNSLDGVPVYAKAGTTAQIAFIPEGKCVELKDNVFAGGQDWAQIDYCGITAWIPLKQLHFITGEDAFIREGSLVYMNSLTEWGISAYKEPSPDAEVVADGLVYGTEFTVDALDQGWARVRHEGKTCWVNMYHMGNYGTTRWKVETLSRAQAVNLRKEPSEGVLILCKIPENELITIRKFDKGWGLTDYKGLTGWVKLHYLTPAAEE
ncbi:MAG: hypothetical protein IKX76_07220 [Eubacterium sp.]|nr:hypothetical protein [Eubacterium sp.]